VNVVHKILEISFDIGRCARAPVCKALGSAANSPAMAPIPAAAKADLGTRGTAQSAVSKTAVAMKAARWRATSGAGRALANLDATPPGKTRGNRKPQ
jgi:hypothetical protein